MSTEAERLAEARESLRKPSVRERVLAAVERDEITRDRRGVKWWDTETTYRLLTSAERRELRALQSEGVVKFWTAGGYPAGWPIGGYARVQA